MNEEEDGKKRPTFRATVDPYLAEWADGPLLEG